MTLKEIGKVKKQALLKQFGSVEKIKQASIEELMKVKGITKELAEKLKTIGKQKTCVIENEAFYKRIKV